MILSKTFSLFTSQIIRSICFMLMIGSAAFSNAEITAESVLGEYWKDPLFGEAAGEYSSTFELLKNRILPDHALVPLRKKVQIVFENKDDRMHVMAFSQSPSEQLSDKNFKALVDDTVLHAQQERYTSDHSHSHSDSDVTQTQEFVKTLDDLPLVVVKPGERKEIIIRFDDNAPITIFCALDNHIEEGYHSTLGFSS